MAATSSKASPTYAKTVPPAANALLIHPALKLSSSTSGTAISNLPRITGILRRFVSFTTAVKKQSSVFLPTQKMRFTYFRGLARVTNWVRLKFAAMNLKKYVLHRWLYCFFLRFLSFFRLSVYSLLIIQKAIFLFLRKMVFSTDCAWAVEKQPKHFCISKTPAIVGASE